MQQAVAPDSKPSRGLEAGNHLGKQVSRAWLGPKEETILFKSLIVIVEDKG